MRFWMLVGSIGWVAITIVGMPALGAEEGKTDGVTPGVGRCREAIETLCPDTKPGSPERRACVQKSAGELPAECRDMMRRRGRATAGSEALRQACGAEIDAHCDDLQRGGGRILRCLRNLDEESLGKGCATYLDGLAAMRAQRMPPKQGAGKAPEASQ